MAYADTRNTAQRMGTAGAVAVIQIAVGYALVTGLAVRFLPHTETKPPLVTNVPLPKPKPPVDQAATNPTPPTHSVEHETHTVVQQQTEFTPVVPLDSGGTLGGTGTGIEDVRLPLPDPAPSPSLSPIRAKPRGNAGLWVTPTDYPAGELRLEHTGVTRFRLTVGADGRVRDCTVTGSSGWPALDATACAKLSSRAKFDPALDGTGARVEGSYSSSVRWQIPE
jgi:protein TonB